MVKILPVRPMLMSDLPWLSMNELPLTHGVYIFYGYNDLPLYIGKANNIRRRVLSHFRGNHRPDKDLLISQQLKRIECIKMQGEVGALLKEALLIKTLKPIYNSLLRKNEEICAWRCIRQADQAALTLARSSDVLIHKDTDYFGLFSSKRKALMALRGLANEHFLCPALLGLEKYVPGQGCFARQIKKCLGACRGVEAHETHTHRLLAALSAWKLLAWPYNGPIGLQEGHDVHIIDKWSYLGTATSPADIKILLKQQNRNFDDTTYKILHKRLFDLAHAVVNL